MRGHLYLVNGHVRLILLEVITVRYQQVDGLHGEELAGRHVPADEVLHLVVVEEGVEVRVREVAVDPRLEVFDVES